MTFRNFLSATVNKQNVGKRLKQLFGNAKNADIAAKLGLTEAAVQTYTSSRVPPYEVLAAITETTKCNLHWLLTGDGPQFVTAETTESIRVSSDLLAKLRTIASEQARVVFADAEIAANVDEKAFDLLVNFLLHRSLVSFNLIASGDIISARDLKRAERFTFVSNIPQSLDDRVKELVRQELAKQKPDVPANQELALSADTGGVVGPMIPITSADVMMVPHLGMVDGGEERVIEPHELEELERRLRSRKRKVG